MVDHNKSHKDLAEESILTGIENTLEQLTPDKPILVQSSERDNRANELVNAYRELKNTDLKLAYQKEEKEKRAAELDIANKKLAFQYEEKEKRAAELIIANKELVFQNEEKEKRAAELLIANIELAFQNEEKEKRAAELTKSQLQLRKFATHLQNIREEEKVAIAREIHDDLGQILVALKIDLGLFKQKISKGRDTLNFDEIMVKFDELSGMVDKTIKTTRRIMTGLRPEIIDSLGFIEAAKSYLLEFEERQHLPCQFICTIPELNTTPQQSVALFRIFQEALNNIVKHAKATAVEIRVRIHANKLILEIKDNGIGFEENHTIRQDSYGMIGMKERVILLDGELFITGKTGKGINVKVEIPYIS